MKDFLGILRQCNPKAQIIWCYGMLGIPLQMPICESLSEYAVQTGDRKVTYLQLPDTDDINVGSREHPGPLCHQQAAEVLAKYIKRLNMDK